MKLTVWQKGIELFELAWTIAYKENKVDFQLHSQFVDAAQSISANIAEGYGRSSINEYIQFLYIALGSLAETLTRATGLERTKQITEEQYNNFNELHYEIENRLLRLIEKLEQKRDTGQWTSRIAEEDTDPDFLSFLHHSTAPPLHHSNSTRCGAYA